MKSIFEAIPGIGQECYHVARRASVGTMTHDRPDIFDLDQETAELIAETLNIYHETGLTPRQILEQRDRLARAVGNARHIIASLAQDESCDHAVGICYCDTFQFLDSTKGDTAA